MRICSVPNTEEKKSWSHLPVDFVEGFVCMQAVKGSSGEGPQC